MSIAGAEAKPAAGRAVSLDILRILAAVWVATHHWSGQGGYFPAVSFPIDIAWMPSWLLVIGHRGFLGVDVFFILSGAVIIHSAVGRPWFVFARNRFLRLFPVYLFATIMAILIVPIATSHVSRLDAWASLSGLQFWLGGDTILGTAWTLPIEVQFYVMVALAILFVTRLDLERARALVLVLLFAGVAATFINWPPLSVVVMPQWIPYFCLGALVGLTRSIEQLRRNLLPLGVAFVFVAVVMEKRYAAWTWAPHVSSAQRLAEVLALLLVVLAFLFWASFFRPRRPVPRVLAAVVSTASLATYPFYLLHEQVGLSLVSLLQKAGVSPVVSMVAVFGAVVLVSVLLVLLFEPIARRALRAMFGWGREGVKTRELRRA